MRLLRSLFKSSGDSEITVRSNSELLHAYHNNHHVSRDECRRLYELVDDPWALGSDTSYAAYADFIATCDTHIDWQSIDWIVDYGAGVGTFTKALKDSYPHIKSIGVDFDTVKIAADKRFGEDLFDYFYALTPEINEYDLLRSSFPDLDIDRLCICFFNSVYYLFRDQRKKGQEKYLLKLVKFFEKLSRRNAYKYLVANSNFTYRPIDNALATHGCELIYNTQDYRLENRIDNFKSVLHVGIWKK